MRLDRFLCVSLFLTSGLSPAFGDNGIQRGSLDRGFSSPSDLSGRNDLAEKIDILLKQAHAEQKFAGLSVIVMARSGEIFRSHYGYR